MKKILCILSALTAGGAETFMMKICRALPAEDYQFDFIVSEDGGCYSQEVLERGGQIHLIPKRTENLIGAMNGIKAVVQKNGYDCVLKLGNPPICAFDLIAARLGGAKRLAMRSCNAPTGLSRKSKCIDALLRPLLNYVTDVKLAPSMFAAEYTFGKLAAHTDVHLLHNGVDLSIFRFDAEGRQRIRREFALVDKLVVGHVGRFHRQKNHGYLLRVFHEIHSRNQAAILLLVGAGEKEYEIRTEVQNLGLEDAVIFAGTRFDVPQILSAMDVFVFPSLYEGMPNTVIEAQATGLPCIVADTITPEADITGLVTYLSLSDSVEQWASCALLRTEEQRRNTYGDFLDNEYDIQSVAKEFVRLICPEETDECGLGEEKDVATV